MKLESRNHQVHCGPERTPMIEARKSTGHGKEKRFSLDELVLCLTFTRNIGTSTDPKSSPNTHAFSLISSERK